MPKLSDNALKVLEKRYLLKNLKGEVIETPKQLFERVANNIAGAELKYLADKPDKAKENCEYYKKEFFRLMTELKFLPNSPTLMNAGTDLQMLSACFVLPVEDSMEAIFKTVANTALIHRAGGGTGFDFSRLRPAGANVKSTTGVASGPISFMRVFDTATDVVKQGGKRRGANMGVLRIDHPDIMQFIECKADNKTFQNFNISVAVTDKFMAALENDDNYDIIDPRTGKATNKLPAKTVWKKIIKNAWLNGDPGIIFIDEINRYNPLPENPIRATNPCGELPLVDNGSCNLGSINLGKYFRAKAELYVDKKELENDVYTAVRFLDNVIDVNKYPIPEIEHQSLLDRKIGLGIMGWADLLVMAGINYASTEATMLAKKLMRFIKEIADEATISLAKERGPFPAFKLSTFKDDAPRRNATLLTIAPTGTISMIADCSSGIEPHFSLAYTKNVMDGQALIYINEQLENELKERKLYSKELIKKIADNHGTLKGIAEVPDDMRKYYTTSHEIKPEWHVRMQSNFQKSVCNSISKTINFSKTATEEDVEKAYLMAYEEKCKGITIYRDGSKDGQVLTTSASKEKHPRSEEKRILERPEDLIGKTKQVTTGCGKLFVTINETLTGDLYELFATMGKSGGCVAAFAEAVGRLASLAFRNKVDPREIIKQLGGITCSKPCGMGPNKVTSCADAVAKAIKHFVEKTNGVKVTVKEDKTKKAGVCPDCGAEPEFSEGCAKCSCGWSQCG